LKDTSHALAICSGLLDIGCMFLSQQAEVCGDISQSISVTGP